MAYSKKLKVSFGAAKTGLLSSVRYKITDIGGTVRISATNTGISECVDAAGNAATGAYQVIASIDESWPFPLDVEWTIVGQAGVYATDTIDWEQNSAGTIPIDLTQAVTLTTGATIGGALSSALNRFLKQVVVGVPGTAGSRLNVYKTDGTTLLASIDLSTANTAAPL